MSQPSRLLSSFPRPSLNRSLLFSLLYILLFTSSLSTVRADTINILGVPATITACGAAKMTLFYSPLPTAPITLNLYIANSGLGQTITSRTSTISTSVSVTGSATGTTVVTASVSGTGTAATSTSKAVVSITSANSATSNTARTVSSTSTTTSTSATVVTSTSAAAATSTSAVIASTSTAVAATSTIAAVTSTTAASLIVASTTSAVLRRNQGVLSDVERGVEGLEGHGEEGFLQWHGMDLVGASYDSLYSAISPIPHPPHQLDSRATTSINTTITTSLIIPSNIGNVTFQWNPINVPVGNYKIYGYAVSPNGTWVEKVTTVVTVLQGGNSSCLSNLGSGGSASDDSGGKSNTGGIVGGVLAGLVLLALLAGGIWWRRRRKQRARRFKEFESWVPPAPLDGGDRGGGMGGTGLTNGGGGGGVGLGISPGLGSSPSGEKAGGWLGKGGKIGAALTGGAVAGRLRSGSNNPNRRERGQGHGHGHNTSIDAIGMRSLTSTGGSLDPSPELDSTEKYPMEPYSPEVSVQSAPVLLAGTGLGSHGRGMLGPGLPPPMIGSTTTLIDVDVEMRELAEVAAVGSRTPARGSVADPPEGPGHNRSRGSMGEMGPPVPPIPTEHSGSHRRAPPSPPSRPEQPSTGHYRKPSMSGGADLSPSLERSGSTVKRKPVPTLPLSEQIGTSPTLDASPAISTGSNGRYSWQRASGSAGIGAGEGEYEEIIRGPDPFASSSPIIGGGPNLGQTNARNHILTVDRPLDQE